MHYYAGFSQTGSHICIVESWYSYWLWVALGTTYVYQNFNHIKTPSSMELYSMIRPGKLDSWFLISSHIAASTSLLCSQHDTPALLFTYDSST